MQQTRYKAHRTLLTAIALLAAFAGGVLLFAIPDPAYGYALVRIAGCVVVAAIAWRRPWLATLLAVIGGLAVWVGAVFQALGSLGAGGQGSSAQAAAEAWDRSHVPFDVTVFVAMLAYVLLAIVFGIARYVRALRPAAAASAD